MVIFYFIGRTLEKKIGSLYLLLIIIKSIFLISFIYLFVIEILKYIMITTLKFKDYNYDFYSSVGFSGVLFSIYYIKCNFSSVSDQYYSVFNFIPIQARNLPIFYLLFNQLINPNSSYIGHTSGIICGWLIKNMLVYFILPSKIYVVGFEENFENILNFLEKKFNYVKINSIKEIQDLQDLEELDKKIIDLYIFKKIKEIYLRRINLNEENIFNRENNTANDRRVNNNNNNYQLNNVHRLDEEI